MATKANFCPNCGKKINHNIKFCPYCGQSVEPLEVKELPSVKDSELAVEGDTNPSLKPKREMKTSTMIIWAVVSFVALSLATLITDIQTASQIMVNSLIILVTVVSYLGIKLSKNEKIGHNQNERYGVVWGGVLVIFIITAGMTYFDVTRLLDRSASLSSKTTSSASQLSIKSTQVNFDGTYKLQSTGAQCDNGSSEGENPVSSSIIVKGNTIQDSQGKQNVSIDNQGDAKQIIDSNQYGSAAVGSIVMHFETSGSMTGKWDLQAVKQELNSMPVSITCNGTFSGQRQ